MAVKHSPIWRVQLYPHSKIPYRRYDAFVVADLMADALAGSPSDWQGLLVRGASANSWNDWARLGSDLQLSNVGFARFLPDGRVSFSREANQQGGGGFFARPTLSPMDAQGTDMGALGTGGTNGLQWQSRRGTWRITNPQTETGARRVFNTTVPDDGAAVETVDNWEKGKGIHLEVDCRSTGQHSAATLPELRIQAAPTLRMVGRDGLRWALEKSTVADGETTWEVWKLSDEVFSARGSYSLALYILGGRLCWQVNGQTVWLTDASGNATTPKPQGKLAALSSGAPKGKSVEPLLGGAPLVVEAIRLRVEVEVSARVQGTPGTVARRVYRQSNAAMRGQQLDPAGVGFIPSSGALQATATPTGEYIDYLVTIQPTEDSLHSPLLSQFMLVYSPVWASGTGDAVDVSEAVNRATLSMAMPPTQAGTEGSLELDMGLLSQIAGIADVTKDYCPVTIDTKWTYTDGSVDADWKGIFSGYLFGTQGGQNEFNAATLSFTLRDPVCRLRAPAAIVDGSCWPLDWAFYRKMAAAEAASQADAEGFFVKVRDENGRVINARPLTVQERSFYSYEAVYEILKMMLGPTEADRLAVFFRADEPPLLSFDFLAGSWIGVSELYGQTLSSGALQAQQGFVFPPPYGEDGLSWINRFAQDVFALFFYGYTDRSDLGYPRPIFGTRAEILADVAVTHQVSGSDPEKLLLSAINYETRPETDVNRILIWSNPFDTEGQVPLSPAFVQGEARFGPSHPRSQENSWTRTKVLETKLIRSPQTARIAAGLALSELNGDTFIFPRLTFPFGDARVMPGDVFELSNAGLLDVHDEAYRADRIEHEYARDANREGATWVMNAITQTMSAREKRALGA